MRRRLPSAAATAVVLLLAGACSSGGDEQTPTAGPTTSHSPDASATPTPEPSPVRGRVETRLMEVSNEPAVFAREGPPTDGRFVRDLVRKSAAWLDLHLTDLQDGGAGKVGLVAADGLVTEASTSAKLAITRGLVPDGAVVDGARYEMLVGVDQTAAWARATVTVTTRDGYTGSAQFVFAPAGKRPTLIAAGPTDPDFKPKPAPAPSASATGTDADRSGDDSRGDEDEDRRDGKDAP